MLKTDISYLSSPAEEETQEKKKNNLPIKCLFSEMKIFDLICWGRLNGTK